MTQSPVAGGSVDIAWEGPLGADTVATFRPVAEAALAAAPRTVTLRLDRVTQLDSSGIGAIVFLHRRLAERGARLAVTGLSGQPLALARMIRLDAALGVPPATPRKAARPGAIARLFEALRPAVQAVAEV